jgi:predicted DNA binding protein
MAITDRQFEFLKAAIERGYFDTPGKITLEQLAEELGVTTDEMRVELRTVLKEASREFWGKIG